MSEQEQRNSDSKKSTPLFKIETNGGNRIVAIVALIGIVIVAVLYVCGLMFSNFILTIFSFLALIIVGALVIGMKRKIDVQSRIKTNEEIDAAVEAYKMDLIDTFTGYDVEYTTRDILEAADKYRERLVSDNESISVVDPNNATAIIKSMFTDAKASRAKRKEDKERMKKNRKS